MTDDMYTYLCGSTTWPYTLLDENYLFFITKIAEYALSLANQAVEYDRNHQYGCAMVYYDKVTTYLKELINSWPEDQLTAEKERLTTLYSAYYNRYTELANFKNKKFNKDNDTTEESTNNHIQVVLKDPPMYSVPPDYPHDATFVPYWKIFMIYKVIRKGGYIGPDIYIPTDIWIQEKIHLPEILMKQEIMMILINDLNELKKDLVQNQQKNFLSRNIKVNRKFENVIRTLYTAQSYFSSCFTFVAPVSPEKKKYTFKNHDVDVALANSNTTVTKEQLSNYRQLLASLFNEFLAYKDIYVTILMESQNSKKPIPTNDQIISFINELNTIFCNVFYYSTLLDIKCITLHYMSLVEKSLRQ